MTQQVELTIWIDGIELDLDKRCPDCNGTGELTSAVYGDEGAVGETYSCPECDGIGFHLTHAGEALKEFILRHVNPNELSV